LHHHSYPDGDTTLLPKTRVRDHTKLKAFALADRLALAVYKQTAAFPKEEIFGLTAQLRRAAVSVPSNIVEGCARNSEADYLHFLDIAYASSREMEYQLSLAARLGYIQGQAHQELVALSIETSKVLAGLLRALRG
jgi:four helix bundle protein